MTMTAAQRQALLEQARQLIAQAEADAPATQAAPTSPAPAPVAPAGSTPPAPAAARPVTQLPTQVSVKQPPAAPAVTGPGGDTRSSRIPSVLETMKTVWSNMRGNR